MDMRQLRYFIAVAEEGNFAAAAMRVNVTQPPVTRQIHALEQDLDVQLFRRTPRGTVLTEAGRIFLDDARQIMALSRRARERVKAAARGEVGRLTIGFFGSSIYRTVPTLLRSFTARVPAVELSLMAMPKDRQIEALRAGSIDAGFSRHFPSAPDIAVQRVTEERLFVAVRFEDPLSTASSLKLADIAGRALVLFPIGGRPSFADAVIGLLQATGKNSPIGGEADDPASALAMVSIGCGVCLVPESVTSVQVPGVKFITLDEPGVTSPTDCVYLKSNPAPILAEFIRLIRTEAAATLHVPPTGTLIPDPHENPEQ